MTGLYVPELAVANARYWADIGFRENPPHSNINPFSEWQYGDHREPYCDSACCYWSYMGGYRFVGSDHGDRGYSWVTAHRRAAEAQGIARSRNTHVRPGWLAIYNFDMPDQHIEMIISRDDPTKPPDPLVAVVGGNTGDAVLYRIRHRSDIQTLIAMDEAGQNAGPIQNTEDNVKGSERTARIHLRNYPTTRDMIYFSAEGGVFNFGESNYYGSISELVLQKKFTPLDLSKDWVVDGLATPTEKGYWILTRLGSIASFGDAKYAGSFHTLASDMNPMVGLVASGSSYMGERWDGRRFTGQPG